MCNLIAEVPRSNSYTKHDYDEGSEVLALVRTSPDIPLDSVCRTIYWGGGGENTPRKKSHLVSWASGHGYYGSLRSKKEYLEWIPRPSVT